MKYIVENWFVIVGLIAVCAAGGYAVYVFVRMPSDKQLNKVREWLLYAVTKAEKELGGGTGQIKLRYVYDMFVARFAWLARVISFEAFSMMVDEALERMKKMLENNMQPNEPKLISSTKVKNSGVISSLSKTKTTTSGTKP